VRSAPSRMTAVIATLAAPVASQPRRRFAVTAGPRRSGGPCRRTLGRRRGRHAIDVPQALQKHQRTLVGSALLDGPGQQIAGSLQIASLVCGDSLMEALL